MTYEEFLAQEKSILAEAYELAKELRIEEFNAKMTEFVELQQRYIDEHQAIKEWK